MTKFSQTNFRKSCEILDQIDKSIKSYIKIFEATGLLGPTPAQVVLTRTSLWGKFTWVGAIIFGGNFIVRGQFSRGQLSGGQFSSGQLSSGAIIWGAIIQGANVWGAIIRGAIFLGDNCPDTVSYNWHIIIETLKH